MISSTALKSGFFIGLVRKPAPSTESLTDHAPARSRRSAFAITISETPISAAIAAQSVA